MTAVIDAEPGRFTVNSTIASGWMFCPETCKGRSATSVFARIPGGRRFPDSSRHWILRKLRTLGGLATG